MWIYLQHLALYVVLESAHRIHHHKLACGDVYDALIQVQHRGQDAAGISTWDTEKISTHKYTGLVTEVFKHQKTFDKLAGNIGIGHVRYPTASSRVANVSNSNIPC